MVIVNVLERRLWGLRHDCRAYGTVRLSWSGGVISARNEGCGRASLVLGEMDLLSTCSWTYCPAGLWEVAKSHPAISFLSSLLQNEACSPHWVLQSLQVPFVKIFETLRGKMSFITTCHCLPLKHSAACVFLYLLLVPGDPLSSLPVAVLCFGCF